MPHELRPYQKEAVEAVFNYFKSGETGNPLVVAPTGCHGKGTLVLLFNGRSKLVEDVEVGDLLMGPDSQPRRVLQLCRGQQMLYRVVPKKGESFIVNLDHVLQLKRTNDGEGTIRNDNYVNISVRDYLAKNKYFKHLYKLYRVGIDLPAREVSMPPWIMGAMLGDGTLTRSPAFTKPHGISSERVCSFASSIGCEIRIADKEGTECKSFFFPDKLSSRSVENSFVTLLREAGIWGMQCEEKRVPDLYKYNSKEARLSVLAGLLDTDGHLQRNSFDFISKSKYLSEDVTFLARSVGLSAKLSKCEKSSQSKIKGTYWRVSISGHTDMIPTCEKIATVRGQKKDSLVSGFDIKEEGMGDFYGFTLDSDHLYLTSDFVVHHNSGKSLILADFCRQTLTSWPSQRILVVAHVKELLEQNAQEIWDQWPSAPIGIYSAGLKMKQLHKHLTIAGIGSIYRVAKHMEPISIVIIDECHRVPNKNLGMYRKLIETLKVKNPNLKVIGLTATPFRLDHGFLHEGSDSIFTDIIYEIPVRLLIDLGHLSPLVGKIARSSADLSEVRIRGGEFVDKDVQQAFEGEDLVKRAVDEMIRFGEDRRSWLIFASGIDHGESILLELRERGVECDLVVGDTESGERRQIVDRFRSGELRALVNVGVFCLDEETEILTSDGFVGIDEMSNSHKIAGWKPCGGVDWDYPKGIVRRERFADERMVLFDGKQSANIRVTFDHRMVVRCGKNSSKIKVESAENFINKRIQIPAFGDCEPEKIYCETPEYKQSRGEHIRVTSFWYRSRGFSIEESKELAISQVDRLRSMKCKHPFELTEDECFLIGFWLGDGTKSCGRVSMTQSYRYKDNVKIIDELLIRLGISHSRKEYPASTKTTHKNVRWTLAKGTGGFNQQVEKGYFQLIPYFEKTGTSLFWGLNKKQLLSLLNGLWLADGNHHSQEGKKWREISSSQYELFNVLQSVCSVRGISAVISKPILPRKSHHKVQWTFSYGGRKSFCYLKNSIKAELEYRKERVWCVTSSTSFLICRRRGRVFVTGNTTGFNARNVDMIALLRATQSTGLYCQILGRGMRLSPETGKQNCLVLDYGGNIERHGPVDQIQIVSKGKRGEKDFSELVLAPTKACPECQSAIPLAVTECPVCGFIMEREKPLHEASASEASPLSDGEENEMLVKEVIYGLHEKEGKPSSMRVTYFSVVGDDVSEWWCFDHGGWPEKQARKFWLNASRPEHFMSSAPVNTNEALSRMDELMRPKKIWIKKEGKFSRIVSRLYPTLDELRVLDEDPGF